MQGRLRNQELAITVETRCEHCLEPMTLEIDSDMALRAAQADAEPMVFIPDVALFDTKAPSIVDVF